MRTILAGLLIGLAAVLAAGCGSSSSNTASTTAVTETTAAAATTAATTSAGTTSTNTTPTNTTSTNTTSTNTTSTNTTASGATTSSGGAPTAGVLSAGCQKVADLSVQFGKALSAATATGSGQTDLQKTADAYKAFAAQVPEEIRGPFQTIAAAFAQYVDAIKGLNLAPGKTPDPATIVKLAAAAKALNNSSLAAANTKIEAWVKQNCSTGG